MPQANPYPLRVDRTLMNKFKTFAAANGRSVNKELEMLMKQSVQAYEAHFGPIPVPAPDESAE